MSGEALTVWQRDRWGLLMEAEDRWRRVSGVEAVGEDGVGKAQCALSTLRNMLRDEKQSVQVLMDNQVGVGGCKKQYHFPDWEKVLEKAEVVQAGEEIVTFRPYQLGGSGELWDVRVMAYVITEPFQHVVAVVRGTDDLRRRCFRVYDNDGAERPEGAGRIVTVESMTGWSGWVYAVVGKGAYFERRLSPRIVPTVTGPGATFGTRMEVE